MFRVICHFLLLNFKSTFHFSEKALIYPQKLHTWCINGFFVLEFTQFYSKNCSTWKPFAWHTYLIKFMRFDIAFPIISPLFFNNSQQLLIHFIECSPVWISSEIWRPVSLSPGSFWLVHLFGCVMSESFHTFVAKWGSAPSCWRSIPPDNNAL